MNNVRVLVGDLFESEAQTLTNTVNTVGIMGKGIALQFKKRFPAMYEDYVRRCEEGTVRLGEPYLYQALFPPWVLNFPTKDHWRSLTRLSDLDAGLRHVEQHYQRWGIESLAVPPLGCGEGGLEWRVVGSTLYRGLTRLDIPVELYAPFGTPHLELTPEFLDSNPESGDQPRSRVPAAVVALAAILERIASEHHHYPIGRTGFQKLAYFATQAGIPTGLEFERRPYGPFADGMKRLLSTLINNGLVEERRLGRMTEAVPGPTLDDARVAFEAELRDWEPQIERVADLFLRLPSTRQAELAASVHYVASTIQEQERHRAASGVIANLRSAVGSAASDHSPHVDQSAVVAAVERWKAGRQPAPSADEIIAAVRTLDFLGWVDVATPAIEDDDLLFV
ncbi:macro domain-containing protein [soil metagenome]